MIDLLNRNPAMVAINNHTPDQRLLRAPSSSNEPQIVADHAAYEGLLERLSKNLPGWPAGPWTDVYYEASSTAEQQAYYAYGAFGFTPEATPGLQRRADVPPALPERHRQLPRHRHALREPDDARPLLRRVQGRDRAGSCTR